MSGTRGEGAPRERTVERVGAERQTRKLRPQPGPQETFSASSADICLFGGSAGGGKTWILAYEAARYVQVPGYTAAIFRRTRPQLVGGGSIWEEARRVYPHIGGVARESPQLDWRFPDRSIIEFHHLQYDDSVYDHQSKQYGFIGFDELTHFSAFQFWYMLSRLRSAQAEVPKRVRGTCNPDPNSFVRELIDWWIDDETGQAIAARSGVVRWLARVDEKLLWGATPNEVVERSGGRVRGLGEPMRNESDLRPEPMSFTFVRASATDNKILLEQDPGYLSRLALIPGAERKRLLDGDWNAKDSAGDYFNRATFPIVEHVNPRSVRRRIRFWDKAATRPSSDNPDPDWTVGWRVAELDDDTFLLEDRIAFRDGPAEVVSRMRLAAELDGRDCVVGQYVDPGQAGKVDEMFIRRELFGFAVVTVPARSNKETFARVWSPIAADGRVKALRREYLAEVFALLEAFPAGKHDDDVDSLSGAFQVLSGGGFSVDYDAAPDPRHPGGPAQSAGFDDELEQDDSGSGRGGYF